MSITQNVNADDSIVVTVAAGGSFTKVTPQTAIDCSVNPSNQQSSPAVFTISNFTNSTYSVDFVNENADLFTVSGSVSAATSWISDSEVFEISATYSGPPAVATPLVKKYSISKSSSGSSGSSGTFGSDGEEGLKSLTGLVYLTVPSATLPGTPTATNYVFSTVSFSSLTANWSLERPTITAGNANNYWESTFNATEDSSASDVSSSSTSPPNLTFSTPVRVQDGFGDSVTESVTDINAASTKWVGVDVITFTEDSTNLPHPRSSSVFSYTYNSTVGNLEFAVGGANTNKSYLVTSHSFFAGDVEVARLRIRHIAEPFSSGNVQQVDKVKSVYYELEVIGTPAATYSTESNYRVTLASSSSPSFVYTSSWVGSGSPTTNGFQEIQNHDMTALSGYQITIEHTPSKQLKTLYVTYTGVADSTIDVDVDAGGKT